MLANDLPVPGVNLSIELQYNPAGQIVRLDRSNDAYAWRGAQALVRDHQTDGQNRYLSTSSGGVQTAAFGYDGNGNLASETTPDYGRSFVYDVENRLVGASGTGGDVTLLYDPLGRLWQVAGASGTTQFLYDGDKLVGEYNGSGTQLRRYVHGPGTDEPVAVYEGAGLGLAGRRYMLPDERGSIAALVNADGSPSVINTYDEYGIPGTGNGGRFQYTGQTWIPDLGLYYYKARFYSPKLGRFLQTDPIGYDDQFNLYAYVGNDPINSRDPTGLQSCPDPNRGCPDVKLPAAKDRADMRSTTLKYAKGGSENGSQLYRFPDTGKSQIKTAAAAGEVLPGESGEFQHKIPNGLKPHLVMLSHIHVKPLRTGNILRDNLRTKEQNGPSIADQRAMHDTGVAVQTIGPQVTTTLYRTDGVDRLRVDAGDPKALPDLKGQEIVVDPWK